MVVKQEILRREVVYLAFGEQRAVPLCKGEVHYPRFESLSRARAELKRSIRQKPTGRLELSTRITKDSVVSPRPEFD